VARVLAACLGFLAAVLWMDLMFDVQALAGAGPEPALAEPALASIAAYYRRATTDAWPMSLLIAVVMLVAIGCAVAAALRAPDRRSLAVVVLVAAPVGLALARVVPNAVRLGQRSDPTGVQAALARAIAFEHVACLVAVATALVLVCGERRSGTP